MRSVLRGTRRVLVGLSVAFTVLVLVDRHTSLIAQGPFSQQIQRAIDALVAGDNTWTGDNTFTNLAVTGTCTNCGEGVPEATYLLQTPNSDLVNSVALSTFGTGLLLNTASTGFSGIYTGATCTNQLVRVLSASGAATCATVTSSFVNNTIALTGTDINTSNQVTALHLASPLNGANGGTGVANTGVTATWGGNVNTASSFTTSGAFALTLTTTGATNVTLPTSGTLLTTTGSIAGLNGTITSATQDLITRTGTLVSGATGAGFTVALTTSTITGSLADARLSANVPLLNAANVFSSSMQVNSGLKLTAGTVATTGDLRVAKGFTLLARDNANANDRNLFVWGDGGAYTADTLNIGDDANAGLTFYSGATTVLRAYGSGGATFTLVNNIAGRAPHMSFASANYTNGASGARLTLGRNSNGTNSVGGNIDWVDRAGTDRYVWIDATGLVRTNTAIPVTTAEDTSIGTVVGDQTSSRAAKNIHGLFTDDADALALITATPLYYFNYKSGAYNHQEYIGITTDDSPEFGQDLGKSFNPITTFGYTVASIRELERRLTLAEHEVQDLRASR